MQSTVRFGLKMFLLSVVASVLGFAQTPSISSVSPNPLGIGQSVTISGTNFGTSGTVTFSGVTASTTSWSSTSIVATAPTGITNGNIVVTAGGHASNGFAFTLNNGPVNYVYDNLGRLIEVVDVNGNAAEYTYDAVGNILSISRFTASQVSISEFNPLSGPVGSSVTIYGSGFSTTLSQNTVKFNGTTATVSSSSTSQLQVTVPSSATTGPISVTSPNGTATSATNFSVTSSNGLPTITSFTPGSGVAATAVSLTGLNFDPTLANDKLRLNASQAVVTTATSTNLSTTVPSATASGHFTLLAPAGTSVSSQDFYVPFNSHVAADIGYTTRITLPGSATVTLTGSHIGLILFDGTEGQHLSIGIGTSTLASCTFYLIAPNDSTVTYNSCTSGSGNVDSIYLPASGTYTLGVDPYPSTAGGSVTISLDSDIVGTISIGGPSVTETTSYQGQDVRLNFTALAGQRTVAYATNVSNPGATLNIAAPPSDSVIAGIPISNSPSGQTFFLDTPPTPLVAGTYQLWVQHSGTNVGSETLQLVDVTDYPGTLTIPAAGSTGTALRVPSSGNLIAGQNANLSVNGTAGQKLSFNLLNSTIGPGSSSCYVNVYDPNHNSLVFNYCGTGNSGYLDTLTLGTTGTYSVYLDPQSTYTGSISVSVNNDQDVTTPTISVGGAAVAPQTTVAGQDVRLSFTPTASQPRIAVLVGNVTNPLATLNLWNGTSVQSAISINNNPSGQTFFLDTQPVNANQQYQLWVQHSGTGIGKESLQIKNVPADVSHTVTVGGSAYAFTTVAGQNANLGFTINSSESITVHWTSSTYPNTLNCFVKVTGPSPSTNQVGSTANCNSASGTDSLGTLASGTYNILVDPQAQSAGGLSLSVTTP